MLAMMALDQHPDSARPDAWSALMAAAQGGDRAAYRALLLAVVPLARAMAARAFRDRADVEDVVQDALATLHATRHMFDPRRPLRPWFAAIVRHRIADLLRRDMRRARREEALAPVHETFVDAAPNQEQAHMENRALLAAVARLPKGQRRAIELTKLQELSLHEAAAATGMSVTALKVATHRAVKRLRRMLGGVEPA
jgi:RNA polymerase sigma-70 factor (ECF subfamily)